MKSQHYLIMVQATHELEEAMLALTALGYSERELAKIRPLIKVEVKYFKQRMNS